MEPSPVCESDRIAANPAAPSARGAREIRRRRLRFAAFLLVGACGAAVLYHYDPTATGASHFPYPKCLFHKCTGLYCPGCGTTRALHALLHGQIGAAIRYNPLTVLVGVPVLGRWAVGSGVTALFPHLHLPERRHLYFSRAIGVVVILFSILRNVPGRPFNYLAPPETPHAIARADVSVLSP